MSTQVYYESLVVTSNGFQNKKRRTEFVATGLDIEPYRRKPKMFFSGMIPRSYVIRNKSDRFLVDVSM